MDIIRWLSISAFIAIHPDALLARMEGWRQRRIGSIGDDWQE
jgi:hypothetical protein